MFGLNSEECNCNEKIQIGFLRKNSLFTKLLTMSNQQNVFVKAPVLMWQQTLII